MTENILIILPTYNESENIGPILNAILEVDTVSPDRSFEVLVVDDNSPDGTQDIVRRVIQNDARVHLLQGQKEGLGRAYIRGFQWGLKQKRYDVFVMMDADFSHNPGDVPALIDTLDSGNDYVIGSRYTKGGFIPGSWPIKRILNSRVANFLAHKLIGIDENLADITGGFKAIRASALKNIQLDNIGAKGYFFQVNLLYEFVRAGCKIAEHPISFADREQGQSKLRSRDVMEFVYRAYMLNPDSSAQKIVRFGVVGLSGTVVNLAALTLSIQKGHLSALTADIIALEISIVSNFLLNHWYTFRQKGQGTVASTIKKLGRFNASAATGATIQFMIFSSLLKWLGASYILSALTAIAISLFWNYWMSTYLVWSSSTIREFLQTAWKTLLAVYFALLIWATFLYIHPSLPHSLVIDSAYFVFLLLMAVQGAANLYFTLYAWGTPERVKQSSSPTRFRKAKTTFSILLPARHEQAVIAETVLSISRIHYPSALFEILVICDDSDTQTIKAAKAAIKENSIPNARVLSYSGHPINKPHGLNTGLKKAKYESVVIFDAEDNVHPDILNVANTLFLRKKPDIIQAGVQLMNYHSNWFSSHNVMEYYFWFKSRMHFNAKVGMVPLGGNTVFFKTKQLRAVGGWNQRCLTEDAEIGIRMSTAGLKVLTTYDARHVTQEETPATISQFIKQRTRWNQGFIQVLRYGDWRTYDSRFKRWFCAYTLSFPIIQAAFTVLMPFVIVLGLRIKLPTALAVFGFTPLLLLLIQVALSCVALYEFISEQGLKLRLSAFPMMVITFIPYNILLSIGALRATYRQLRGVANWEKTAHFGTHRQTSGEAVAVPEVAS